MSRNREEKELTTDGFYSVVQKARGWGRGLSMVVDRLAEWSERMVDGQREVQAELTL